MSRGPLKPVVLQILSQPPRVLGLPTIALVPLAAVGGVYVMAFVFCNAMTFFGGKTALAWLNGLGWVGAGFLIGFLSMASGFPPGLSAVMGACALLAIAVALPLSLLATPLGWAAALMGLYFFLRGMASRDAFEVNMRLLAFSTPRQRSHLRLPKEARRYV